jgi:uncharacterized protein (TIRG00374 family)
METKQHAVENKGSGIYWKKLISIVLRIAVSLIILYFIISLVTWESVVSAYASAYGTYLLLGALLLIANLSIRTLKWRIMLHTVKRTPSFWESFGSVMLGISLGSFTPGEIGEFAGRALHISNAKKSHLVGLALLDKAQIFVITSAAGIISLAFFFLENPFILLSITSFIVLFSLFLFFRMDILASAGHRLNTSFFQRSWLTRILDGFTLLEQPQLILTLLSTVLFHCIVILQMFFFLNAFHGITFIHACIGTSAMMFIKSCLPISLSDLGIREAGSIFFFSAFGIPQAAALNASLLLFVINIFIPSIIGIIFLRHQHIAAWTIVKTLRSKSKT